jgi:hypothetical protein
MKTMAWWSMIAVAVALSGCGDTDNGKSPDAGKDVRPADVAVGKDAPADLPMTSPEVQQLRDVAADAPVADVPVADAPVADRAPDLASVETSPADRAPASEAGGAEAPVVLDAARDPSGVDLGTAVDVTSEAGNRDGTALDSGTGPADVAVALNVTCRNDSDCCIVINQCTEVAYLYSKAPGATGPPSFPSNPTMCVPCIPPAIQVRCDVGRCVGQKVSGVYSGPLLKDHCGPVASPDAGTLSPYQPAYAGAQPTSLGCGS